MRQTKSKMVLKDAIRKSVLKKYSSTVPTSILPLSKISTAVAFIDVEDTSFNECKDALMSFFRANSIKGEIFFFDFRKIISGERLITSITNTILKKDLNWYGKPSDEKIAFLDSIPEPDVLISLLPGADFTAEFAARYCKARFKIGRVRLPGDVFDLVVSDPSGKTLSQAESFEAMKNLIGKIQ